MPRPSHAHSVRTVKTTWTKSYYVRKSNLSRATYGTVAHACTHAWGSGGERSLSLAIDGERHQLEQRGEELLIRRVEAHAVGRALALRLLVRELAHPHQLP